MASPGLYDQRSPEDKVTGEVHVQIPLCHLVKSWLYLLVIFWAWMLQYLNLYREVLLLRFEMT